MPRKPRVTHLQRWMSQQDVDIEKLAIDLDESYGRIAHYVRRGAIPKPPMVRKLIERTGLPAEAFLFPFDAISAQRSEVA
jgi:hypothetical protein